MSYKKGTNNPPQFYVSPSHLRNREEFRTRAIHALEKIKANRKGKVFELIQIDEKTWKEVEVMPKAEKEKFLPY